MYFKKHFKTNSIFQIQELFQRRDINTSKQGKYIQDKISTWVQTLFRYVCTMLTISVSTEYDMVCWVCLAVMKYDKHHRVRKVIRRWVVCHVTSSPWFLRQDKQTTITLTSISSCYLNREHVFTSIGICIAITEWIWRIHCEINASSTRRP